ncbi:hypothetical protein N7489_011079 [Penicillium chrysogenum]|uniref:Uncharacterized protein n=1 Tax=Penicillium chrysogenum TaxID=5076 RepID=A0ABQ8WC83_PENCH|nr:uncharacterized protein N7489_011079 [Penicillium chrysogenum]XP_061070398.1 uncharacterized protein N7525_005361 [Penicillium rubens]KAJ5230371.1 hypothetical protein N7489_011079 [Penicillium chrysogenum]KAJ5264215.1 hypothetical protein N7505_008136 [Penicillium chrysogenum]KAJ5272046.1 hypothetical protein N7524_005315 [Penicillium chrysogenum]KAJ5840173.1 hypothetical protein N7525_005361 [Penicillium rubens]KAJ6163399.1 hypothetical protein N7497_003378 [Penicillium chrysogenum]
MEWCGHERDFGQNSDRTLSTKYGPMGQTIPVDVVVGRLFGISDAVYVGFKSVQARGHDVC